MVKKKKAPTKSPAENLLQAEVSRLTKQLRKANALWLVFLRGVVSGTGAALGATVIAGIVLLILFRLIQAADSIPFLENVIDATQIDRLVEEQLESSSD